MRVKWEIFLALAFVLLFSQLAQAAGGCEPLGSRNCGYHANNGQILVCCTYDDGAGGLIEPACDRGTCVLNRDACGLANEYCEINGVWNSCCVGYACNAQNSRCAVAPDLTVFILDINPELVSGEQATLQVLVDNQGNAGATGVVVGAQASDEAVGVSPARVEVGNIEARGQQEISFTFTCPDVGARTTYTLTITADPDNAVLEGDTAGAGNEGNNIETTTLTCTPNNMPNLALQNPAAIPPRSEGGQVSVNVRVSEIGGRSGSEATTIVATPVSAQAGAPAIAAQTQQLGALAAGGQADVSFEFACPNLAPGSGDVSYSVRMEANPAPHAVAETNYADNSASVEMKCLAPPPPPPPPQQGAMSWLMLSGVAILFALSLVILAYMATYIFNMPQIRGMLKDELLQVMVSGAMLLILAGVAIEVDNYMVSIMLASGATGVNGIAGAMGAANSVLSDNIGIASGIYDDAKNTAVNIGKEGSKSIYCTFLGVGFSLNNCGQLNAFRGSMTTAGFVASTALSDLYAEQALLSLAQAMAFTFFIPVGLFFRCFKFSRMAGGALIAIGFGFYTVFPVVTVATDKLLNGDTMRYAPALVHNPDYDEHWPKIMELRGIRRYIPNGAASAIPEVPDCDPRETDNNLARKTVVNFAEKLSSGIVAENVTYNLMVRVIFSSIFALMVTLVFIRSFAKMIGSDIDVSSLARIA